MKPSRRRRVLDCVAPALAAVEGTAPWGGPFRAASSMGRCHCLGRPWKASSLRSSHLGEISQALNGGSPLIHLISCSRNLNSSWAHAMASEAVLGMDDDEDRNVARLLTVPVVATPCSRRREPVARMAR